MSSWGWGSKFSNLQQVGDFSIFGSKSSFSGEVGGIKFEFWWGVLFLTRHLQCPSGVQAKASKHEAEGRVRKLIPADIRLEGKFSKKSRKLIFGTIFRKNPSSPL